jgi:hypothetical protein
VVETIRKNGGTLSKITVFGSRAARAIAIVSMEQQPIDDALQAANLAIAGRSRQSGRFASVELRTVDPQTGAWEVAAVASVALATLLLVLGVWFL